MKKAPTTGGGGSCLRTQTAPTVHSAFLKKSNFFFNITLFILVLFNFISAFWLLLTAGSAR
jgi:hypothetical protein